MITVVSGLPRSGTSMAMQMLHAGGMAVLADGVRAADADNPRGYFEFERVKALRHDKGWLDQAEGRVVKIIHLLLPELPLDRDYRVLFMERSLPEVVRSQSVMLERSGRVGGGLAPERLMAMYQAQLQQVHNWLAANPRAAVLTLPHAQVLREPAVWVERVDAFLGGTLDRAAMVAAVDPSLHRNRV
jgi:hypothetical protein